jgi:AcrR family transcriptional regulator
LYHYPSKDDLRRKVLEQMLAHWNEVVPQILRAATTGQEQFDAIACHSIAFFSENPDRARLLLRELLDRPDEMKPLIQLHVEPWARIVCDYIRKGQEQGRVDRNVDPESYVVQIINLVLCGIAIHESIGELLPPDARRDGQTISARHLAEMLRVAKSALFVTPATEAAAPLTEASERERSSGAA